MTVNASQLTQNNDNHRLIKRLLHACVREQLLPHSIEENQIIITLNRSKATIVASEVSHFNLGKFRIDGEVTIVSQKDSRVINDVRTLLNLIYDEINDSIEPSQWDLFVAEIDNCNTNEEIVTQYIKHVNKQLANKVALSSHNTLLDYISSCHSPAEQMMFFEAWAAKGHPYHPCHKTKLGFSTKAYMKYSPEFNQDIHLPLAAIAKSIMHVESEQDNLDFNNWFAIHYPQAWHAWLNHASMHNISASDYYPIFIHPWQYENVLTKLFADLINKKELILFNDVYINTKASLSFRTLMVKDQPQQPHIKLPVAVRSTSAMRTITPASVHNDPKIGKILRQIISKEQELNHYIKLAYETCGMHVQYDNQEIAKHLGVIYRENPTKFVNKDENPIVVAALFEESPVTQLPLLIEMIQATHGLSLNGALEFFNDYCNIVMRAYLDLFLIYGIALEGHQQNTLAVFKNNQPVYMVARDLGGLRLHAKSLEQQGYPLVAHPESATITHDRQEVTNKFLHSVIQYHLGEIVLLLSQHYHTPEQTFWKTVKHNLVERFHAIKDKVKPERWQQEYQSVLEEDWQIKGLMRMRLNNVYSKYIYIHLKNPLREC